MRIHIAALAAFFPFAAVANEPIRLSIESTRSNAMTSAVIVRLENVTSDLVNRVRYRCNAFKAERVVRTEEQSAENIRAKAVTYREVIFLVGDATQFACEIEQVR